MRALTVLFLLAACSACAALGHTDDPKPRVRGPIPSRTQEPIKLTFLAFRPRAAEVQPEGTKELRITSAYSSIFENGDIGTEQVVLDGEIWRTGFAMTWGIGPRTDLEVEVPVVFATSGFLDRFVESWHSFFAFPDGGREERERFTYEMRVEKDGDDIYQMESDEAGLGDIPIVIAHQVLDEGESAPAVTLRAGVELPTGSESNGFGNGGWDWGGGVIAQKSWGRWTATAGADYVVTARPSSFVGSGVDASDDFDMQLGVEYRWNDALSLLAGIVATSPVTDDLTIMEIDSDIVSADVGIAFDLGESSTLIVGFEDDVVAESGPDFTVFASWSVGL
jgi:hypothetical protein